jgi:hypothetical protein
VEFGEDSALALGHNLLEMNNREDGVIFGLRVIMDV